MNHFLARIFSSFILDKKIRRDVRDLLLGKIKNQSHDVYKPATKEELERTLSAKTKVTSLHECIAYYKTIDKILSILTPYSVVGFPKVRVGGEGDGGYVMLDPGRGGVAYSLGVSANSPWDLEMAVRGYNVFQFDGAIENPPDIHPNLYFEKTNVVSPKDDEQGIGKSLGRIFQELRHQSEDNIILQMDIEGCEWEIFDNLSESAMRKFRQMIVEFHYLTPTDPTISGKLNILKKISRTHKPIHIHLNNCAYNHPEKDELLFYSSFFEVTYVRSSDYEFEFSRERFPTSLDSPNIESLPDIAIGAW